VGSVGLDKAAKSNEKANIMDISENGRYPGYRIDERQKAAVISSRGTTLAIAVMLKISLSRFFSFDHFSSPPTSKVIKAKLTDRSDSVLSIKLEGIQSTVFGLKSIPVKIYPIIFGIPTKSHSLPMKYPRITNNPIMSNVFIRR
jgi:hypothetical protein